MTKILGLRILLVVMLSGWPALVSAGEIYGRVRVQMGNNSPQPVPEKTRVVVAGLKEPYSTLTGSNGSYQLTVPESGTWSLAVEYKEHSPSCQVTVIASPTEHNLLMRITGSTVVLVEEKEKPAATGKAVGGSSVPTVTPTSARTAPAASTQRIALPSKKAAPVPRKQRASPPVRSR